MRKRLWFLGLILVLAIPLVWVLKDFAREAIATPLLYVLWIGDLFFQSIPQVLFWALFLASALIVAGRSLIRGKKPAQQEREAETVRKGQVQVLTRWLLLAAQEDYFEWRLARHLGELTSAVLAQRERTAVARMRQHWRLSARHPRTLFTNEFEQERIADVGLILDARQRSDIRLKGDSLFEYGIRAAAALAGAFLNDGNRVGLLVYGRNLDWTFPGYGKVQRERILRALTRAKTGESLVFDNLDYLPTRFFPARSQIVVISPLCREDLSMLIRLRAHGYQLLLISPDPITFEAKALGSRPIIDLAVRIAHLERTLLLRNLRQAGIQIVDWQVDQPFDQTVHTSLHRLPYWYRVIGVEPRA